VGDLFLRAKAWQETYRNTLTNLGATLPEKEIVLKAINCTGGVPKGDRYSYNPQLNYMLNIFLPKVLFSLISTIL
jgi:hypothetical protein